MIATNGPLKNPPQKTLVPAVPPKGYDRVLSLVRTEFAAGYVLFHDT